MANAELLAVPDGVDGPGAAHGDLSGALPEVPARARAGRHVERHVCLVCGDGEMDEPESLGAIGLASREKLDNLIFVINCSATKSSECRTEDGEPRHGFYVIVPSERGNTPYLGAGSLRSAERASELLSKENAANEAAWVDMAEGAKLSFGEWQKVVESAISRCKA
jgi:hypothetical protein